MVEEQVQTEVSEVTAPVEGQIEINDQRADKDLLNIEIAKRSDLTPLCYQGSNGILRQVCATVTEFDEELSDNLRRMKYTMKQYRGYGLSAPQVGLPWKYFVYCVDQTKEPKAIINPQFFECTEPVLSNEGCLSIPGVTEKVERFNKIRLAYQTETGEKTEMEATGLEAVCIQHEMDHLIGVLFIDRLSRLKRNLLIKKYEKKIKQMERNFVQIRTLAMRQ